MLYFPSHLPPFQYISILYSYINFISINIYCQYIHRLYGPILPKVTISHFIYSLQMYFIHDIMCCASGNGGMADALDSGSSESYLVRVQVPFSA